MLIVLILFGVVAAVAIKAQETPSSPTGPEVLYSDSAKTNQPVYFDPVSVKPVQVIDTSIRDGSGTLKSYRDLVVCRCETADGTTVQIILPSHTYCAVFDADAKFPSHSVSGNKTVSLSGERLHGIVREWKSNSTKQRGVWFMSLDPAEAPAP